MRIGMSDECITAVVGDVEQLMPVGGPGIGSADALRQVAIARARGGPESERAVHMNPSAVTMGDGNNRFERIERADVHVAGLRENERRLLRRGGKRFFESVRQEAASLIDRQIADLLETVAQQADRALESAVTLAARKNADRRRAEHAALFDIPTELFEKRVPGGGKACGMGHLASGNKREAGAGG